MQYKILKMSQIWKILVVGVLIGSCQGQFNFGTGWTGGLFDDLGGLNAKIQDDVSNLNHKIQQDVQKQIEDVKKRNQEIFDDIAKSQKDGIVISGGSGQSISVSNIDGRQRTVITGRTESGEIYYRETEDNVINNILYHTDKTYDKNKKLIKENSYTLDLSVPNAKPVPVKSKSG